MKFDLELEDTNGCISLSLNREFADGEIENIVKLMKGLLKSKPMVSRQEALDWAMKGEPAPSVLAWGDDLVVYYELTFQNPINKISAIKVVRNVLGCALKEAKDMVEGTMRIPPLSIYNAKMMKTELDRSGIKEYTLQAQ